MHIQTFNLQINPISSCCSRHPRKTFLQHPPLRLYGYTSKSTAVIVFAVSPTSIQMISIIGVFLLPHKNNAQNSFRQFVSISLILLFPFLGKTSSGQILNRERRGVQQLLETVWSTPRKNPLLTVCTNKSERQQYYSGISVV